MDEAFSRIYFAKVKLNKVEGKYEVFDNFNKVCFRATIPEVERNFLQIVDIESHSSLFNIVKSSNDTFTIKTPWGEDIGFVVIHGTDVLQGPTSAEILSNERKLLFQATKMPLIQSTNEFQVTSSNGDDVGRINSVRSKAVMSMQPELKAIHRIRIIASSFILLGLYNQCW